MCANSERLVQLKNMLKNDVNDSFLLFALAKEYEKMELFEEAKNAYEKIKTNDPEYIGLYYHLGHLWIELDQIDKAMNVFEEGISIAEKIKDLHSLSELKSAKLNLELGL